MGSVNNQIHNFINTAYNYKLKRSEKDVNHLQRQLQLLSVVSDLRVFEPTSMEVVEFYICLDNLLSEADVKSNITWKVINLLMHICKSSSVRIALRDEIQLLPSLAMILLDSRINSDRTHKTLQLMQEISYGINIQYMHVWIQNLIPHLVELIKNSDGADGIMMCSLKLLNNLCRKNPLVVNILQGIEDHKKIIYALSRHKNATITFQLLAAEVMFFMEVDQSLIMNQVASIIGIICKASIDGGDVYTIQLASDILEEMSTSSSFQEAVKKYEQFADNIKLLIKSIQSDASSSHIACMFNVLNQVIKLEHPEVKTLTNDIIVRTIPWMFDKDSGLCAINLIETIYTYSDESVFTKHYDEIIAAAKNALNNEDSRQIGGHYLQRVNALLRLIQEFCKDDPSFKLKLAMALTPECLFALLNPLLEASQKQFASVQDLKTNLINNTMSSSGYDSLRVNQSFIQGYANSNSSQDSYSTGNLVESLQLLCSEVIVRILHVAKLLGKQKPEFQQDFNKMLSLPDIMTHIIKCSESKVAPLITLSYQVLYDGTVPKESIANLVKAKVDYNNKNDGVPIPESLPKDIDGVSFKNQMFSSATVEKVLTALERLRGYIHEHELKNLPLTDLMDMYTYALAAKEHTQYSLKEALNSMDNYNRQLQQSLLQSRTENDRLRYLLRGWERHLQSETKNSAKLQLKIEKIQNEASEQRCILLKDKTETERKVEKLKMKVLKIEQELESKNEEVKRNVRLMNDAQNENKKLAKQIKEEKETSHKLQENIHKLEDEHRKHQKELENKIKENQKLEKTQSQLKQQISELEILINSHEQTIAEKDASIEELNKNNEALKRIQDMIHNISSGKC